MSMSFLLLYTGSFPLQMWFPSDVGRSFCTCALVNYLSAAKCNDLDILPIILFLAVH